jgi:hypothetical protein
MKRLAGLRLDDRRLEISAMGASGLPVARIGMAPGWF